MFGAVRSCVPTLFQTPARRPVIERCYFCTLFMYGSANWSGWLVFMWELFTPLVILTQRLQSRKSATHEQPLDTFPPDLSRHFVFTFGPIIGKTNEEVSRYFSSTLALKNVFHVRSSLSVNDIGCFIVLSGCFWAPTTKHLATTILLK